MKSEVIQEKLSAAVRKAERFAGKHLSLPILSHLLLVAERGALTVRATNLDMGIECVVPAKVDREGVIAVPAAVFSSFIGNLRNAKSVTLELHGTSLRAFSGGARAEIHTASGDDFPTVPKAEGTALSFDPHLLVKGFRSVLYAGALGNLKPELSSVYVYNDGENLVFAATDSFRLAEKKVSLPESSQALQPILVPVKNAAELVRLLEEETGDVSLSVGKGQMSVETKGLSVTSRLVDGAFPDYRQIIPKEFSTEAVVLREDVAGALKTATLFSDRFNQLRLKIDPKKKVFELVARNGDIGESAEEIPAALTGGALESNFNHRYVRDCLAAIGGDSIAFRFSGENRPLLISGVGDTTFRYLVMPMNR